MIRKTLLALPVAAALVVAPLTAQQTQAQAKADTAKAAATTTKPAHHRGRHHKSMKTAKPATKASAKDTSAAPK